MIGILFRQNLEFSVDIMSNEGKDDVTRISDKKGIERVLEV